MYFMKIITIISDPPMRTWHGDISTLVLISPNFSFSPNSNSKLGCIAFTYHQ